MLLRKFLAKQKERRRKEFAARLKYGKNWHYKLYPHRYTDNPGP